MPRSGLIIDYSVCFDCKACVVACQQENHLPPGSDWIRVTTVGPRQVGDRLAVDYVPVTCVHCSKPPCAEACPTKAIEKRDNGAVAIDAALCNGCLLCISACPLGVIRFAESQNVVEKCNLCPQRIEKGQKPACVHHCQAGAILYGDVNQISRQLSERRVTRRVLAGDRGVL